MYENAIFIFFFPLQQKLLISGEKMLMSAEPKERITWFIYIF